LKQNGIEPAPERKRHSTWKTFLQAHWETLAAIDFTTIEVWTKGRLVTYYLLFVLELATRRVQFAGLTPSPDGPSNLNAHLERFMRSIKEECLSRMIFFGEHSLCRAVAAFLEHYYAERNHQGLDNRIIAPSAEVGTAVGKIECRERLGGMLRYYYRTAA
jgi:putative transposase